MPISNAEFAVWLRNHNARRVVLLETRSWVSGGDGPRYFSDRGFTSGAVQYPGRILSVPLYSVTLSEQLRGVTTPARGEIVLANADGVLDTLLSHAWDGREFALYIGDATWDRADFRKALGGVVQDITVPDRDKVALVIRDMRALLDKPLTETTVASGIHVGKRWPICYGECSNIAPVLIDEANNKYAVHDGQIEDVVEVRVNGVSVSFSEQFADGTFTLIAPAAGQVTADVKGAKPSGSYLTTTANIIANIAQARCGLTGAQIASGTFSAFNSAQAATVGLFMPDGGASALSAIDALTLGAGGYTSFNRDGQLTLGLVGNPGTPALTLQAADIYRGGFRVLRRMIPRAAVRLGYDRRWTTQTNLDATVTGDARERYATKYSVVSATNSVPQHLLAESNTDIDATLFVGESAAQAEATRRAGLAAQVRYLFQVDIAAGGVNASPGDTVRIFHPRYGFSGGLAALIVGIEENPAKRWTRLTCWR